MSGQNVIAKVKFKSETEAVPKLTKSTVLETAKKHSLAPAQVKSLKSYYSEYSDHNIFYKLIYIYLFIKIFRKHLQREKQRAARIIGKNCFKIRKIHG